MAGPVCLAPDGVWLAAVSPRRWWALTPPFHPCLGVSGEKLRRSAVSFLCHFPSAFAAWLAPASCPAVSGLSSTPGGAAAARPAPAMLAPPDGLRPDLSRDRRRRDRADPVAREDGRAAGVRRRRAAREHTAHVLRPQPEHAARALLEHAAGRAYERVRDRRAPVPAVGEAHERAAHRERLIPEEADVGRRRPAGCGRRRVVALEEAEDL